MAPPGCEDDDKNHCKQIGEGECQTDSPTRIKCLWKCEQCECKDTCTTESCTKKCKESTKYKCERIASHRVLCPASCGLCGQGTELHHILKHYVDSRVIWSSLNSHDNCQISLTFITACTVDSDCPTWWARCINKRCQRTACTRDYECPTWGDRCIDGKCQRNIHWISKHDIFYIYYTIR